MNETVLFIKDVCVPRTGLLPIVNEAKFILGALPGQLAAAAPSLSQQVSGPSSCGQDPAQSLHSLSRFHKCFFNT